MPSYIGGLILSHPSAHWELSLLILLFSISRDHLLLLNPDSPVLDLGP